MSSKIFSATMMSLLVLGTLALAFNIQPVRATGTIYINADGSISPPTAPIYSADNITYALTGNITADFGIWIERDNIIVDGAGYTVQGTGGQDGIDLTGVSKVTIKNTTVEAFDFGIFLAFSSNNSITGNKITNDDDGIVLYSPSNYNSISGNNIANNGDGIYLYSSSNNTIYHNNFINNTSQVYSSNSTNVWDNGYTSGGNYWSDYNGTDSNHDGIGDTPYVIDANNLDNYPLMSP